MAVRGPEAGKRTPLGAFLYWTAVAGVWLAIAFVGFLIFAARGLPDTSKLYEVQRQPSITFLDRNGALIAVRGSQYAPPVDVDSLPAYVPAAFVAIEDRRFYHHPGFDPIGMARAVLTDLHKGHAAEGASTITQQLARNLFLTPDKTFHRKLQEIMLAVWLEHKFSKKQILGLYLNRVYFGGGAYGIQAASQRYFDKPATKLNVGEAALLAGMMKAPSRYSPVNDAQRAARRATIVLDEMQKAGVITADQRAEATARPVVVSRSLASQHAEYYIDWLDQEIRALVGEPTEDLIVETTLDLPIQTAAEKAVTDLAARDRNRGVEQAALVAIDGDGRVRAMVGGVNYADSQFNRAADAKRQAGSSWKPFVYLAAMEAGYTPDTPVVDEPVNINGWQPHNFEGTYLGSDHHGDRARPVDQHGRGQGRQRGRHRQGGQCGAPARHHVEHRTGAGHGAGRYGGEPARDGHGLCGVLQRRLQGAGARHQPHSNAHRPYDLRIPRARRRAPAGDRQPAAERNGEHDAPGDRQRHRPRRAPCPATTSPARPAPPATSRTPGSSATPAASPPRCGPAGTTTRPCAASPAAGARPPSGTPSWPAALPRLKVGPIPGGPAAPRRRPTLIGDTGRRAADRATSAPPPRRPTGAAPPPGGASAADGLSPAAAHGVQPRAIGAQPVAERRSSPTSSCTIAQNLREWLAWIRWAHLVGGRRSRARRRRSRSRQE